MKAEELKEKVLTEFNERLSESECGYVVSWHLADPPLLRTPKVNQILQGEVKAGRLHYVSYRFATFFYQRKENWEQFISRVSKQYNLKLTFESSIAIPKQ